MISIDRVAVGLCLSGSSSTAKGEPAWPPLAEVDETTAQLKAKAIQIKSSAWVDSTIVASAGEGDDEAHWVQHEGKPAVHGLKAHVGADTDAALIKD